MNILERTEALGLRVISYTSDCTPRDGDDGGTYWIPRDCIARDGRSAVLFHVKDSQLDWRAECKGGMTYDFSGWEPFADGPYGPMFGGRHRRFESALAWLERARDINEGWATDFSGC